MAEGVGKEGETSPANGSARWAAVDADVVSQHLDDELVIVHLRTNKIFVLNRTAAKFWSLIEEGIGRSEIAARLEEDFDVDAGALRSEIHGFIETLTAEQLIDVDDARA